MIKKTAYLTDDEASMFGEVSFQINKLKVIIKLLGNADNLDMELFAQKEKELSCVLDRSSMLSSVLVEKYFPNDKDVLATTNYQVMINFMTRKMDVYLRDFDGGCNCAK